MDGPVNIKPLWKGRKKGKKGKGIQDQEHHLPLFSTFSAITKNAPSAEADLEQKNQSCSCMNSAKSG